MVKIYKNKIKLQFILTLYLPMAPQLRTALQKIVAELFILQKVKELPSVKINKKQKKL